MCVWMGIIPACAGNTVGIHDDPAAFRDHPRVCGEHNRRSNPISEQTGSSPRVRGTLAVSPSLVMTDGIIPACAGNTRESVKRRASRRDHPRVCGEHPSDGLAVLEAQGSSPRVRGTLAFLSLGEYPTGIIPACAGNTDLARGLRAVDWDHPRVCGEHTLALSCLRRQPGSSPRVRGTRFSNVFPLFCMGIIPACAGNT